MSMDKWIEVTSDKKILMHVENDGWTFMRSGAERVTKEVTLEYLARTNEHLHKSALYQLSKLEPETHADH